MVVASSGNPACASSMGRPRKKDRHLPPCVYQRHGAYWYVKGGKWTRLGTELREALEVYAGLASASGGSMPAMLDKVLGIVRPSIAKGTYRQYKAASQHLRTRLAEFAPDQVRQGHVAQIKLDMSATPNMANRALTFLSIVFTHLVEWQIVQTNPCTGIKRYTEAKRKRYIDDAEYGAIYAQAGARLQVIMDLLYLTGQRVNDVLKIHRTQVTLAGIMFAQQKTGKRLCVAMTPELQAVVDRAKGLRGKVQALTLLSGRGGKAPDYRTVRDQWEKACEAAGVTDAQLRDIRAKSLTDAKRQGLNPTALAGHASSSMTERYIRDRAVEVVSGPSIGHVQNSIGHAK